MGKLLSYDELKFRKDHTIFESEEVKDLSVQQISEAEQAYFHILEHLNKGTEIDEGFLSGLIGGTVGALAGPAIGRAICKALGIEERGTLGKLLTSRLVTTAIGVAMAK